MAEIKKIKVGTTNYDISALYLQSGTLNKSWADIEALVTAGFTIEVPWTSEDYYSTTAPTAAKLATVPAVTVYYNGGTTAVVGTLAASVQETKKHIYLTYHAHDDAKPGGSDKFDEWVSVGTGISAYWEKIGTTDIDLSSYAKKGTYTSAAPSTNETSSAGGATITSSEVAQYNATGTAAGNYLKATQATSGGAASITSGSAGGTGTSANTGNAGGVTVNGSNFTFGGTAATINSSGSYTPAGSISNTYTNAGTISINHVTGAALAAAPTFTGTAATITVEGDAATIDDHSYTPAGTISAVTAAAHSHTVNVNKATVTPITGIPNFSGGELTGTKTFVTSAIKDVTLAASTISTDGPTYVESVTHTAAALTGTTTFNTDAIKSIGGTKNYGFSASQSNVMTAPTVDANGVLSWSLATAETQDAHTGTAAGTGTVGISGGSITPITKYMKKTTTAAGTGTVGFTAAALGTLSTATITYVTGATTGTAGAINVTPTFTGTAAAISHSFTDSTTAVEMSGAYTPAGTVSKPNVNLTSSTKTVAIEGIKSVASTFAGTAATISVSAEYTPAGTIGGSQTIAAHSHSYTKPADHTHSVAVADHTHTIATEVTAITDGAASVKVLAHTHTVTVAGHTHDLGNHTHNTTL